MGTDYAGNYGVGIQIYKKEFDLSHAWYDDFEGYLDELIADSNYYYFEVGAGTYTKEKNEVYLCIDNPFENGYCELEEKAINLIQFLNDNDIKFEGKIDVVGGLNIY